MLPRVFVATGAGEFRGAGHDKREAKEKLEDENNEWHKDEVYSRAGNPLRKLLQAILLAKSSLSLL
jgi:hypothetical protein